MHSSEIVRLTLMALTNDKIMERPASLALIRNLHHLPECELHANDGSDHIILRHDDGYVYVVMSNNLLPAKTGLGYSDVPSGMGEVRIAHRYDTKNEALLHFMSVMRTDNDMAP